MAGPSPAKLAWNASRPGVGTPVGTWYASLDMLAIFLRVKIGLFFQRCRVCKSRELDVQQKPRG